jgi:hypothetical protein
LIKAETLRVNEQSVSHNNPSGCPQVVDIS